MTGNVQYWKRSCSMSLLDRNSQRMHCHNIERSATETAILFTGRNKTRYGVCSDCVTLALFSNWIYSMLSEVFNLGCLKNTKIYLITFQKNIQNISKAVTKAYISCSLIPQSSDATVPNVLVTYRPKDMSLFFFGR